VILMNLGMLVYVSLFAMTQTRSRQSAWFQSFVVWFLFDVFVSSTGVVLVTHILIPLYVMSDIRTIKKKVLEDINVFREKQKQKQRLRQQQQQQQAPVAVSRLETRVGLHLAADDNEIKGNGGSLEEFNSAKYLFTSWRVASLFPDLPESELILQFSTPWPKKSFKREKMKVAQSYDQRYSFIMQALSRVLIFFISGLIQLPTGLQDLLIQVSSNSGLGYVVLLMLRLYFVSPLLPLAPIVALAIVIHFLLQCQARPAHLSSGQSVSPQSDSPKPLPIVTEKTTQPNPPSHSLTEQSGVPSSVSQSSLSPPESKSDEDLLSSPNSSSDSSMSHSSGDSLSSESEVDFAEIDDEILRSD
jgi:hypothetical protein